MSVTVRRGVAIVLITCVRAAVFVDSISGQPNVIEDGSSVRRHIQHRSISIEGPISKHIEFHLGVHQNTLLAAGFVLVLGVLIIGTWLSSLYQACCPAPNPAAANWRLYIFPSVTVAAAIVTALYDIWVLPHKGGVQFKAICVGSLIGFASQVVLFGIFALVRYMAMRRIGMTPTAIEQAVYNTGENTDLNKLFKAVDKDKLRAFDAVSRKSGHVAYWGVATILFIGLPAELHVIVAAGWGALSALACLLLINSNSLASYAWWGSTVRVWDGRWKRWNSLYASTAGGFWSLLALSLIMKCGVEIMLPAAVFGLAPILLVTLPLTIGDSAAELVGSLLGRHFFTVKGMGEINKKTYEGCAGFCVCTYAAVAFVLLRGSYGLEWHLLAAIVILFTMIAETFAYRSLDNIFILITGGTVICCFVALWPLPAPSFIA